MREQIVGDQSWLRDEIFYSGLDRKIPKSRGPGWGFENPETILKLLKFSTEIWNTVKSIRKGLVFHDFLTIGIFRDFLKIPGIFVKSPVFGFFSLGIFIPGIRDFSKISEFLSGDFRNLGFFRDFLPHPPTPPGGYPGFFSWDIPTKSYHWYPDISFYNLY